MLEMFAIARAMLALVDLATTAQEAQLIRDQEDQPTLGPEDRVTKVPVDQDTMDLVEMNTPDQVVQNTEALVVAHTMVREVPLILDLGDRATQALAAHATQVPEDQELVVHQSANKNCVF